MTLLTARDAYPRWAATYEAETVVSRLEDLILAELGIETAGLRLLDVGCGTGRRMRASAASCAVGIDLSIEMLQGGDGGLMLVSDARMLPLRTESFDVVWCRLMIGHLATVGAALREMARVCVDTGSVVLTDIAPAAYSAGHRRTFRASNDELIEIEHHMHDADEIVDAAHDAGLRLSTFRVGVVGDRVRPFYERANALQRFEQQRGDELVHAMVFTKS